MTAPTQSPTQPPQPAQNNWLRDEIAYLAPMFVFLVLVQVGNSWKSLYAPAYVARGFLAGILLVIFWKHYTKIRWNHWWLGIILGVVGLFQWVGMQAWLGHHFEWFAPAKDAFDPTKAFSSPAMMWSFIIIRIATAALVVPFMEELFWRDYLWRQILAPNDFKLAQVGEFDWLPFIGVACVFATVHGNWWPTAIVWGLMIAALLVYTKSLGACIIMHGVTNLLLGLYVLKYHAWHLW